MVRMIVLCAVASALLTGCSDQVERFRGPVSPYCREVKGGCMRMSSNVVEKINMTEFSAARRRHRGVKRRAKPEVAVPEVSAVKVPVPDVQEYIPVRTVSIRPDDAIVVADDDPLLTAYWPALEGAGEAEPALALPIEPPAPKASPRAPGEGFWSTGWGKVAVFGLIVAFWAVVAGILAWPKMIGWRK